MKISLALVFLAASLTYAQSQEVCTVARPTASFVVHHASGSPPVNADPESSIWRSAARSMITKDCTHNIDYPELETTVAGFWTDLDLYLLFKCPYKDLNLWLPPMGGGPRNKLWDRDVVEMFLGDDWTRIRHYREFEIAPTGDWIDLAIDLDKDSDDQSWRSGWQTVARIDKDSHTWYAAAKIPLKAVSVDEVHSGTKWRVNLYRIEGLGQDPERHFMCWQPTCVLHRDPNHVPENFGTLIFEK